MAKSKKKTVVWMTGLSGAGKTTIAEEAKKIYKALYHKNLAVLDGDEMRKALCSDLGFTVVDREENIRRIAHVAKILSDNGVPVIVSTISPTNKIREIAKSILGDTMKLVYVSAPLEVCQERDVKGLYQKAREGRIPNMTGVGSAMASSFEQPDTYDLMLPTEEGEDMIHIFGCAVVKLFA